MTLCGLIVAAVLLLAGYKPRRFGYCFYFEVGDAWGGLSLGVILLKSKGEGRQTMCHEHGHALQNCAWGFLMPFVIGIPSAMRYWWRTYQNCKGVTDLPPYDAIWFEGQATRLGTELLNKIG